MHTNEVNMNTKKRVNRGTINYLVDIIIGLGFIVSMFSGLALLFVPSGGGFQGGRNPQAQVEILGMSRWFLKDLHTYSSILMGLGVLVHLVLHWSWMVCVTRNLFYGKKRKTAVEACDSIPGV